MEASQYLTLSSVSEIYIFDSDKLIGLITSFITLFIILFLLALPLYLYFTYSNDLEAQKKYKCKELLAGLKNKKSARLYPFLLLLRRIAIISWLLCMSSYSKYTLVLFLVTFQVFYLIAFILTRPFEAIDDNLVEMANEIFFTFSCSCLLYLNTPAKWEGYATEAFLWVLLSNNSVVGMIIMGKVINY